MAVPCRSACAPSNGWPMCNSRRRAAFARSAVTGSAAGASRPHREADWEGALVVVEDGVIELECVRGGRRRFETGAVLWLSGIPLVAMHNPGPTAALVVAVFRRGAGATAAPRPTA